MLSAFFFRFCVHDILHNFVYMILSILPIDGFVCMMYSKVAIEKRAQNNQSSNQSSGGKNHEKIF